MQLVPRELGQVPGLGLGLHPEGCGSVGGT